MPPKKKIPPSTSQSKGRSKKNKQPTQKPPMQRIKILGADGKIRWEWREWGS